MRANQAAAIGFVVLVSGCLGGGEDVDAQPDGIGTPPGVDYSHLGAEGARILDGPDTRSFLWDGTTTATVSVTLLASLQAMPSGLHKFDVDRGVAFANASLTHDAGPEIMLLSVRDVDGRIVCAVLVSGPLDWCTAPVAWGHATPVEYEARVQAYGEILGTGIHAGGAQYHLNVTLEPASHLRLGNLTAGVDERSRFRLSDTNRVGGEPTLGVTSKGTLFALEDTKTLRSRDDGATWQDVTPPLTVTSLDPYLFVDPWTDRVYVSHLYVGCSQLWWSDDDGDTWLHNPAACGLPANDHQKLAVGSHFLPSPVFDGIVYYSFASFAEGIWVSRSLDGGAAWTSALAMSGLQGYDYVTGGPVAADRQGTVYVPAYLRGGGLAVAVSRDHGATWGQVRAGIGEPYEDIDPGLAIDAAGNAYGAYVVPGAVQVVASTDRGGSWTTPAPASPPELKSFVLVDAVAGDAGRVALAYLATPDTSRGPNRADGWARWHLYVSLSEDAAGATPHWTTTRLTPLDDPVQIGPICTEGIACFGGNRNLLDFIDVQAGPDGRIYVAYTDGCGDGCDLPQESRDNVGFVAVQEEGPRLFAERAPWA